MGTIILLYGVSGCGKTTVGLELSKRLKIPFYDADDFHSLSNKNKMKAGIPLNDGDRQPWLSELQQNIIKWAQGKGAVLACSALKEKYRKTLQHPQVRWVLLYGSKQLISDRLLKREDHFFDPTLLDSQFETLEEATYGERYSIKKEVPQLVDQIYNFKSNTMEYNMGLIGLGVMGKSLAENLAKNGTNLAIYNREIPGKEENIAADFVRSMPEQYVLQGHNNLSDFVHSLTKPRSILLMVNAGEAVDAVIASLTPKLSPGDLIIDGGNSHYKDTERRMAALSENGIKFLGVGISGGEAGAKNGPSIMPGGSKEAYAMVQPFFNKIAAKDKQNSPCSNFIGKGGAGHFVKMIHNGIEYAEMQIISEVYHFFKTITTANNKDISNVFKSWSGAGLQSYLLDISANILLKKDGPDFLLDKVLDKAGQKGTGGWSTQAALELGIPLNTISEAVMVRNLSGQKKERVQAAKRYGHKQYTHFKFEEIKLEVQHAYQLARIVNHAIGIDAIRLASDQYNWNINLSDVARIWTNGCIIKSELMEELVYVLRDLPDCNFLMHTTAVEAVKKYDNQMASFIFKSTLNRMPIPVISAAWNYLNGWLTANSSANMIQAQRDCFGAHTYKRNDRNESITFHSNWD